MAYIVGNGSVEVYLYIALTVRVYSDAPWTAVRTYCIVLYPVTLFFSSSAHSLTHQLASVTGASITQYEVRGASEHTLHINCDRK